MSNSLVGGILRWIFRALALVLGGILLLIVSYCTYTAYSPHLLLDPINKAIYDAPRFQSVDLASAGLRPGLSSEAATGRLKDAGYRLGADYSTDTPPTDPHPDDDLPQSGIDAMFSQSKREYNARGITHVYKRSGRLSFGCSETFFGYIGVSDGKLALANGESRWTCL